MIQTVLITGANRGIGLELTKQYAKDGWHVIATCRQPDKAEKLQSLDWGKGRIDVYPLDVKDQCSIEGLARTLEAQPIDCLINNAGIYEKDNIELETLEVEDWLHTLHTNTIAPVMVTKAFLANIRKGQRKLIATVSSRMGSIQDNTSGSKYMYRSSKAALNMVAKSLAVDLKPEGITVITLHPGWVRTDMGTERAPLVVEDSVAGLRQVLASCSHEDTGRFVNYDGTELPW